LFACGVLAFTSLKYMPVGEFTAITLLSPLVITLLSVWTLKESIHPLRWLLVMGGFVGTLVIIRPGSHDFDWTLALPLLLVLANAGFQILTSHMSKTEDPITTHFYTGWIVTVLASLILPFVWQMPADGLVWLQLLLMGLMGSVGHFFPDPGLWPRPGRHTHPLHVRTNWFRCAGRLDRVQPPARPMDLCGHGSDCAVWRFGGLAHRAREPHHHPAP
jgi:hypothetical protein